MKPIPRFPPGTEALRQGLEDSDQDWTLVRLQVVIRIKVPNGLENLKIVEIPTAHLQNTAFRDEARINS